MQKYESAFAYLHASFVSSLTIYRNSCEELLSPLDLPDSQLFELLEDIDGRAWASAALDARVRTRLGSNYLPLKSSVKQLNKKIELFAHKLKLEKDFRVRGSSQSLFRLTHARHHGYHHLVLSMSRPAIGSSRTP
jgi:hypothetical protein